MWFTNSLMLLQILPAHFNSCLLVAIVRTVLSLQHYSWQDVKKIAKHMVLIHPGWGYSFNNSCKDSSHLWSHEVQQNNTVLLFMQKKISDLKCILPQETQELQNKSRWELIKETLNKTFTNPHELKVRCISLSLHWQDSMSPLVCISISCCYQSLP